MLDKESMDKFLSESEESIKSNILKNLQATMEQSIDWSVKNAISAAVTEYVTTQILPKVIARLCEEKPILVEMAVEAVGRITPMIGDALVESLKEKLGVSYKRQDLIKQLFA